MNGFFGKMPDKDTTGNGLHWTELTDLQQLDGIVSQSHQAPVMVFKHSTRCGISGIVLRNFERHYDIPGDDLSPYYLDLLAHRDVSNEIARRFGVVHQSPQILLIRDGECFYTASHSDIDVGFIKEKIRI
jgi:bacillithiol system protein YtxJ